MSKEINKDFMQYVYARIEKALTENELYMKLQKEYVEAEKINQVKLMNDISDEMECEAEVSCYLKGFNDARELLFGIRIGGNDYVAKY